MFIEENLIKETDEIIMKIREYYILRGLAFPSFDNAMKFAVTEIAEALEVDLARYSWVRNHPEDKPAFDSSLLSTELGDAIMMLLVAGITEGENPLKSLLRKMNKKVEKINAIP